jgi:hypothetical protein
VNKCREQVRDPLCLCAESSEGRAHRAASAPRVFIASGTQEDSSGVPLDSSGYRQC